MQIYKAKVLISKEAIKHNTKVFRHLINKKTRLLAVVKSNAYGHGLVAFSKILSPRVDWFGVDSVREALQLRKEGIKKPILVFGYTMPALYSVAERNKISLSFFNESEIKYLKKFPRLKIHLKIDTGMHRQGIYVRDLSKFIKNISGDQIEGVYTHFAGAKDPKFRPYTLLQLKNFNEAIKIVQIKNKNVIRHAAATSAVVNYPDSHFDMIRVGAGIYGLGLSNDTKLKVRPVLSFTSIIAQVKKVSRGNYIGYDLTEKVLEDKFVAVVPIGYWHGIPRTLSRIGEALVNGHRAKILGIVSMDAVVISLPKNVKVSVGDEVVFIGRSKNNRITVRDIARKIKSVDSEVATRINPLIPRIII